MRFFRNRSQVGASLEAFFLMFVLLLGTYYLPIFLYVPPSIRRGPDHSCYSSMQPSYEGSDRYDQVSPMILDDFSQSTDVGLDSQWYQHPPLHVGCRLRRWRIRRSCLGLWTLQALPRLRTHSHLHRRRSPLHYRREHEQLQVDWIPDHPRTRCGIRPTGASDSVVRFLELELTIRVE